MPATVYARLEQLKARLGIGDTRDDETLQDVLEAVSRMIDGYCGTRFFVAHDFETRYFTAERADELLTDDLLRLAADGLATDSGGDGGYTTTWATTDYVLAPYNALTESRPYWRIELGMGGLQTFPVNRRRGVRVTGDWGFSTTAPSIVESVCLRESLFQFQANATPYGITVGDGGVAVPPPIGLSKTSQLMLAPFRRLAVA